MALNGLDINALADMEAACLVYALYKRLRKRKERKKIVTKQSNSTASRRLVTK
jgi:hypothetical protein